MMKKPESLIPAEPVETPAGIDHETAARGLAQLLATLHGMAAALNEAASEQAVADAALAHLLALPFLAGAAVGATGPDGGLRMLAAHGMPDGAAPALPLLRLPLLAQRREVGVLELLPAVPQLGEAERALLGAAASQLGSALERVRLYACMETLLAERTEALRSELGAEERLRYLSNFDTLTGLPNRMLLRDRLRQMKVQAQGAGQVLGFMLVSLGRMPLIREALGPEAEQALLREAAARLRMAAGADAVGRFSDGSFAVLAQRAAAGDLAAAARRLLAAVGTRYLWETEELHLDPAIGISVFPNDGVKYEALVQGAEAALRQAQENAGQRCAFYRPELNQGANDRFKLESALRRAIQRDELVLHYQPLVDLASGRIVGAEALLRWQHPERGLVSPCVFVPLAEETGLILPIGDWVLSAACRQQRAWREAGLPLVPVSVNLSSHQFDGRLLATVARVLGEGGIAPQLLVLELTESASMADAARSCALLAQLKSMGVGLAIDDFGTGYSNLNYLKRFPVDKLKLDQSFVADLGTRSRGGGDLAIARAVIAMAHGLRLKVVAEGVESAGQLALLAAHGCDIGQGYYFSRPVPAAEFGRMLRGGVPPATPPSPPPG